MTRKPTQKEIIDEIAFEMKARSESLIRLVNKLNREGYLTQDERELAKAHTDFIQNNKQRVKDFYKPATVLE